MIFQSYFYKAEHFLKLKTSGKRMKYPNKCPSCGKHMTMIDWLKPVADFGALAVKLIVVGKSGKAKPLFNSSWTSDKCWICRKTKSAF